MYSNNPSLRKIRKKSFKA